MAGGPGFRNGLPGIYQRFGKLQDNELTREMADELLEPAWGNVSNTARRRQGLLHRHHLLSDGC